MRISAPFFVTILLLASCGADDIDEEPKNGNGENGFEENGPDADTCFEVCAHVYDSCRLELVLEDGQSLERQDCVAECMANAFGGNESCLAGIDCQRHSAEACLRYPSGDIEIVGDYECDLDEEWPEHWERFELEVLVLVNQQRQSGAPCGVEVKPPVEPLVMERTLWCAARRYSRRMAQERFFDHECPDGGSPFDRIDEEGYEGGTPQGENLAQGSPTPEGVVDGWMDSPGHCENIMRAGFAEIGIGYDDSEVGFRRLWTQKFGGG